MEVHHFLDLIPGALMVLLFGTLLIFLIDKFAASIIKSEFKTDNAMVFVALFLFVITLIAHLFRPSDWTADILKVIIGLFAGAGVTSISKKSGNNFTNKNIKNSSIQQALGDINTHIKKLESAVSNFNNASINNFNKSGRMVLIIKTEIPTQDVSLEQVFPGARIKDFDIDIHNIEQVMIDSAVLMAVKKDIVKFKDEGWDINTIKFINVKNNVLNLEYEVCRLYPEID